MFTGALFGLCIVTPARADYLETLRQTDPAGFLHLVTTKAQGGDVAAQMVLGEAYENGEYTAPHDDAQALSWYRRAAEMHNGDAELAVARFYQDGKGVPRDAGDAAGWLQMAADDGNARALDFLGDSYLSGRGVKEDDAKAVELYRQAAKHDVVQSQVKLASLYYGGQAVAKDYGAAYYWYRLARANPDHRLFPELDAAVEKAGSQLSPIQRKSIDRQVEVIIAKVHPEEVKSCDTPICISTKR